MDRDKEGLSVLEDDNTYGCDLCGERRDWDAEIVWLTSSFGVCEDCYEKMRREKLERNRKRLLKKADDPTPRA